MFEELREIRSKESTESEISLSQNISKAVDCEVVLQLESLTNEIKTHWSGQRHNCLDRNKMFQKKSTQIKEKRHYMDTLINAGK